MMSFDRTSSSRAVSALGLIVAGIVFGLDQVHKTYMLHGLGLKAGDGWAVTPFLNIVLHWNTGVSYGLLGGIGPVVLIGLSVILTLVFLFWLYRATSRLVALSLGLIIGGALGNVADRLLYGKVADFFHFHLGAFNWPVFNLADVWIVAGLIGVLYDSIRNGRVSDTNTE